VASSVPAIAEKIITLIQKQGKDYATVPLHEFYELTERERLKKSFMDSLKKELKKKSYLLIEGSSVIVISKDFNSNPLEF